MSLNFEGYHDIPEHTRQTLVDYVELGYEPGGFVSAVLSNNLVEAFGRGDMRNIAALGSIVKFMYNRMPMNAWGSEERVLAHLNSFDASK